MNIVFICKGSFDGTAPLAAIHFTTGTQRKLTRQDRTSRRRNHSQQDTRKEHAKREEAIAGLRRTNDIEAERDLRACPTAHAKASLCSYDCSQRLLAVAGLRASSSTGEWASFAKCWTMDALIVLLY